jgi:hemoglobin
MIVPETHEHRQAITRQLREATGLDEPTLERLIRTFYATARTDPLIGELFDGVDDWEHHIATITAFWSSVALMTGTYHGQPMAKHVKLPLQPDHFARWLMLFEQTARSVCTQQGADLLIEKSRRIAQSLQFGIDAHRGELPRRSV